jgi:polysaccharide export outer membrane protein
MLLLYFAPSRCSFIYGVFVRVAVSLGVALYAFSMPLPGQATVSGAPITQNQQPGTVTAAALPVEGRDYVIAPDDILEVYILDVPELSRNYRISQSGQLVFPLLAKPLMVAGLTLDGFSELLTNELKSSGTISDPHVSVSVKESRLHSVSITGSVKSPQVYPLLGPAKLLSVLSQAGGVTDDAGSIVKVTRGGMINGTASSSAGAVAGPAGDSSQTITINLNDLLNSGDTTLNIDIFPGDWVTVPRAGVIYVVGAVNRPGGFVLNTSREHLSVLQLVALAEDLKPTARREHSMIIRRNLTQGQERQEIAVNLKTILSGKSPDITLEPNDILFVPDSSGKRAVRRGAEAAIQIATGLALFRL